jgi:ribosomal protein L18
MATGARYFVPYRRRREGKTDYYQRTKLVVADVPRMVVRKTNRHIIIQLVTAEMDGDRTLVAANSSELTEYGYKGTARRGRTGHRAEPRNSRSTGFCRAQGGCRSRARCTSR